MPNQSLVSEFLLLQFSETRELQILRAFVFLSLYLATVAGNLLIIAAVAVDRCLHTPMYFFLMNLAMQDLGQVSVILPKSLLNSLFNTRHISYAGCVAQVLLFLFFLASDMALLTVMAYDRYVAICNPLQYEMIMNKPACAQMIACVWSTCLLYGALHTSSTFTTSFCSNVVNQFFCEVPQILKLSCSDLNLPETGAVALGAVLGLGSFLFIVVTYVHIFITILRMPSMQGRQKAFSTCVPHITVFSTLVFTGGFAYFRPTSNASSHLDLAFTVVYSMMPPLLNPVIYGMRNKAIKIALSKLLGLKCSAKKTFFSLQL